MRGSWKRRLAVTVGAFVLLSMPGTEAIGHVFNVPTTVDLNVSRKRFKKPKRVTIHGRLRSTQPECVRGREVTITGRRLGRTVTTDGTGRFSTRTKVRRTTKFVAQALATVSGPHPHRHACGGDSDVAKVKRVRRRG
jgi:acyl-coenzyme A thioesterase PaaI-like protein